MNASEIISVLKSEIADFDRKTGVQEGGTVVRVGDGIATVYGMQHAMYGELVEFETGVRGIIQNLEEKTVGVVLLGSDYGIVEGTQVMRTKKRAGVGVGSGLIGRVVDALGAPIDGGAPIEPEDYYPIEREAAGVADRKSVSVPLQTGILSIDSMFPIGRGQRELIIGDRQTGKTSIAVDTIINQKGQDVICIYVAIGQKSSTVAKIVNTLKTHGAMDYSVVVSASASAPAPVQYIAPYSGTAMAEFFMHQGKDVLIIYDDLSKHAVAYRAMSLLLHRPPGREAYPGDVFYLHSRLLERSCRLDDANHRNTGRRYLRLHSDECHLHHRWSDLLGKRIVLRWYASGSQCWLVRFSCRRCCSDQGNEKGCRKDAYGTGTVPRNGSLHTVQLRPRPCNPSNVGSRSCPDGTAEAAAVSSAAIVAAGLRAGSCLRTAV